MASVLTISGKVLSASLLPLRPGAEPDATDVSMMRAIGTGRNVFVALRIAMFGQVIVVPASKFVDPELIVFNDTFIIEAKQVSSNLIILNEEVTKS
jgi:hypothetical protein